MHTSAYHSGTAMGQCGTLAHARSNGCIRTWSCCCNDMLSWRSRCRAASRASKSAGLESKPAGAHPCKLPALAASGCSPCCENGNLTWGDKAGWACCSCLCWYCWRRYADPYPSCPCWSPAPCTSDPPSWATPDGQGLSLPPPPFAAPLLPDGVGVCSPTAELAGMGRPSWRPPHVVESWPEEAPIIKHEVPACPAALPAGLALHSVPSAKPGCRAQDCSSGDADCRVHSGSPPPIPACGQELLASPA